MSQFTKAGNVIEFTATQDEVAGAVVVIGQLLGQTHAPVANGTIGSLTVEGVISVPKAALLVLNQGNPVFWNVGANEATALNTDEVMGYAEKDAADTDAEVRVKLTPMGRIV